MLLDAVPLATLALSIVRKDLMPEWCVVLGSKASRDYPATLASRTSRASPATLQPCYLAD